MSNTGSRGSAFFFGVLMALATSMASSGGEIEDIPRRDAFLRKNFEKFVPIEFEQDDRGLAKIQRLRVREHLIPFGEQVCFGFRFKMPDPGIGDFSCMYLLMVEREGQTVSNIGWNFLPKNEPYRGRALYERVPLAEYPELKKLFPKTQSIMFLQRTREQLTPGNEYAVWFMLPVQDYIDVAFAMTLDSPWGRENAGRLPAR